MPFIKVNFFFSDTAGYGWTEGFHSSLGNLTAAMNAAKDLFPLRRQLLGRGAYLEFIRVSDETVKNDSEIFAVPPGDQELRSASDDAHDSANLCALVRIDGNQPDSRRSLYLRGFKDKFAAAGAWNPDGTWTGPFNRWVEALKQNGWSVKRKKPGIVQVVIDNITQVAGQPFVTVTTATPHGFPAQAEVTFIGVRGVGVPTGSLKIRTVVNETSFTVNTRTNLGQIISFGGVRLLDWDLIPISNVQVMRLGHRISGRPFSSPRGRRPARARI